jgi:hypothetical protein
MAATRTTDIQAALQHLSGPAGGSWGFLYSSCVPPPPATQHSANDGQEDGAAKLRQTAGLLDMAKLAQLLSTISRPADSFPGVRVWRWWWWWWWWCARMQHTRSAADAVHAAPSAPHLPPTAPQPPRKPQHRPPPPANPYSSQAAPRGTQQVRMCGCLLS